MRLVILLVSLSYRELALTLVPNTGDCLRLRSQYSIVPLRALRQSPTVFLWTQSVDEIQSQGINVQDINKLKAAGICTVLSVSQTTRRNLLKIKGLSEAKVEKLKEAAAKMLPPTFATAAEIGLRREACVMITTGSKTVDAMLGGESMHLHSRTTRCS